MKNSIFLKIAKSLCAVFLAFAVFFLAYPEVIFADEIIDEIIEEETTGGEDTGEIFENVFDPLDGNKPYKYHLEIEFGTLSFYYDWGEWDPDVCRYVADQESDDPAHKTIDGEPGWYGFDGIANRISFINTSPQTEENDIVIYARLDYHTNPFYEDENFPQFEDFAVSYYNDQALTSEILSESSGGAIIEIPYSTLQSVDDNGNDIYDSTDVYLSIEGEPYVTDQNGKLMFHSQAFTQIGFLMVTIATERGKLDPGALEVNDEELLPEESSEMESSSEETVMFNQEETGTSTSETETSTSETETTASEAEETTETTLETENLTETMAEESTSVTENNMEETTANSNGELIE